MQRLQNIVFISGLVLLFTAVSAQAARHAPAKGARHEATGQKAGQYIADGFYAGGDSSITSVKLMNIRRAAAPGGYERIVLDLKPLDGMSAESGHPSIPHFQVTASSAEGRIIVSIWSDVSYDFDLAKIKKAFKKSAHVRKVNVVPRVEDGLSIIEFSVAGKAGKAAEMESFFLTSPSRIIIDVI